MSNKFFLFNYKMIEYIVILIIILFIFSNFSINKILKITKNILKCSKALLVIVPLIIIYFNQDMVCKVLEYLGYLDNTGLYNSKKDLLLYLGNANKLLNNNTCDTGNDTCEIKCNFDNINKSVKNKKIQKNLTF